MSGIKLFFSAVVVALGIIAAGYLIQKGLMSTRLGDRYVSVRGLAEKEVKSDKAIWRLQFNYANDDLTALYQGVAEGQKKIQQFLISKGFKAEEVQFQPISVTDNEGSGYSQNEKTKRYNASATVMLTSSNVDLVNSILQQTNTLLQSGIILNNSEVRYLFTQLNAVKPEMLNMANQNAKEAALTFARNSGNLLGKIRQASQGLFTVQNSDNNYGDGDPMKIVRVVNSVQYYLRSEQGN